MQSVMLLVGPLHLQGDLKIVDRPSAVTLAAGRAARRVQHVPRAFCVMVVLLQVNK